MNLPEEFPNIESASILLPYGYFSHKSIIGGTMLKHFLPFENINLSLPLDEFSIVKTRIKQEQAFGVHPMTFQIGVSAKTQRPYRRLVQKFPAILIDSNFRRKNGFYYKLAKNNLLISKTLATNKIKEIERQAGKLLEECNRFFFLYCEVFVNNKPTASRRMPF